MNKRIATVLLVMILALACQAEAALKKVYNEDINPVEQIDQALAQAKSTGKFVICQVGGNWCHGVYALPISSKMTVTSAKWLMTTSCISMSITIPANQQEKRRHAKPQK